MGHDILSDDSFEFFVSIFTTFNLVAIILLDMALIFRKLKMTKVFRKNMILLMSLHCIWHIADKVNRFLGSAWVSWLAFTLYIITLVFTFWFQAGLISMFCELGGVTTKKQIKLFVLGDLTLFGFFLISSFFVTPSSQGTNVTANLVYVVSINVFLIYSNVFGTLHNLYLLYCLIQYDKLKSKTKQSKSGSQEVASEPSQEWRKILILWVALNMAANWIALCIFIASSVSSPSVNASLVLLSTGISSYHWITLVFIFRAVSNWKGLRREPIKAINANAMKIISSTTNNAAAGTVIIDRTM